jgi:hypothetical protein
MHVVSYRPTKLQPGDARHAARHVRRKEPVAAGTRYTVQEPKLQWRVVRGGRPGMKSVKGVLLWLVGIPLPIILLIALFLHPG